MKLTIDQAFAMAVEAQRAGKTQEADRYYTAILRADPRHPDTNHNMGALAVSIGKVQESLTFFKKALEVNPSITQYWLSYIEALINLERMCDAAASLDQAKQHGVKGDAFSALEDRLSRFKKVHEVDIDPANSQQRYEYHLENLIKLYNDQQYSQARTQALRLLKYFPNAIDLHNILGASNRSLGNLDEAIAAYKEAISIKPDYAEAHNNMGVSLHAQYKLKEAIASYQKAILINPNYTEAFHNMGNTLYEQGRLEDAIAAYRRALCIKPDYANAYISMGNILHEQSKLEEAAAAYEKGLLENPADADAFYNLANTFYKQGNLNGAIDAYRNAVSIRPDYADAHYNMGIILQEQSKLEDAIAAYEKARFEQPDNANILYTMANALREQGKLENALSAYQKALSIKPNFPEVYNNIGVIFQEQSNLEDAIAAYSKAIYLNPSYAEAHRNLSTIKKYIPEDKHFLQVRQLSNRRDLSEEDQCHLNFALAKMNADIGELKESFISLSKGNALRKKLLNYSIARDEQLFACLKKVQPELLKAKLSIKEEAFKPLPIFVLGMPRSGTTLVEQIISSHSEVFGAGELNYVAEFGRKLALDSNLISPSAIVEFRQKYLSEVSKLSDERQFITDKMPQNFRFIPLICAAFPEAKIVHLRRDAAAVCWSNYENYFVSRDLGYSYDLRDVVEYYKLYNNLLECWQHIYSNRIYNLNYENLTTDQASETKKLIEYLDLNWEHACLSPESNKRSVRTASQQQVRKKMYKSSSDSWRKYEKYLKGVFENICD